MATRMLLTLMVVAAAAFWRTPAQAGEPTPAPGLDATPTVLPAGSISIRVIDDLNGDGIAQDDDPGLAGWTVLAGCSDGIQVLTTDAEGYTSIGGPNCIRVDREFGWLPTSPIGVTTEEVSGSGGSVSFLLRNLGPNVMELSGEAIVAGLPAVDPVFGPDAPFAGGTGAGCVSAFTEEGESQTISTAIVVGDDTQAGCPASGDTFTITMNGQTAASGAFSSGATGATDFVVGGDSMRLYVQDVDGAIVITGVSFFNYDCAVIVPITGFVVEGAVRLFVLSHEAKSGCAIAGNTVIFTRGGNNLQPTVPWEAGTPEYSPPLVLSEGVVPVDTGGGTNVTPPEGGDGVAGLTPPDTGSAGLKALLRA